MAHRAGGDAAPPGCLHRHDRSTDLALPAALRSCARLPMLAAEPIQRDFAPLRRKPARISGGQPMTSQTIALATIGAGMVMLAGIANAAEIRVIGSPGTREPYTQLVPGFEKATGHKVTTTWGGVNAVAKRVTDGEVADVVMLPAAQIDDLIKQGKLVGETRVNVATSGVGVAIRAGAPKIDAASSEG